MAHRNESSEKRWSKIWAVVTEFFVFEIIFDITGKFKFIEKKNKTKRNKRIHSRIIHFQVLSE